MPIGVLSSYKSFLIKIEKMGKLSIESGEG